MKIDFKLSPIKNNFYFTLNKLFRLKTFFQALTVFIFFQNGVVAHASEKINICSYDLASKGALEKRIGDAALGKRNVDFPSLFSEPIVLKNLNLKINESVKELTGVTEKYKSVVRYSCNISEVVNYNWIILFVETEEFETNNFSVKLYYNIKDFSEIGLPFDARMYEGAEKLFYSLAYSQILVKKSREEIKQRLISAHFIFNRTCELADGTGNELDLYFVEFENPDTLWGKLITYPSGFPTPFIYVNFDKNSIPVNLDWRRTKANYKCMVLGDVYKQQAKAWLHKNFPNNWVSSIQIKSFNKEVENGNH